jgi:hypothetical protein
LSNVAGKNSMVVLILHGDGIADKDDAPNVAGLKSIKRLS